MVGARRHLRSRRSVATDVESVIHQDIPRVQRCVVRHKISLRREGVMIHLAGLLLLAQLQQMGGLGYRVPSGSTARMWRDASSCSDRGASNHPANV